MAFGVLGLVVLCSIILYFETFHNNEYRVKKLNSYSSEIISRVKVHIGVHIKIYFINDNVYL